MVDLRQAIQIIEGGAWCSLRFITADVKKGTGGKVIELPKCRIARNRNVTAAKAGVKSNDGMDGRKDPAHNINFTRNMELHGNKELRKVHPILITHINNQAVV